MQKEFNIMHLRIHHFFDIIRDIGSGKPFVPHSYQNSYHLVAEKIRKNQDIKLHLVLSCDDVCQGCIKLKSGHCTDTVSHRTDFSLKEEFNNHIDRRIMDTLGLSSGKAYTANELIKSGELYKMKAGYIYAGNDEDHTAKRIEMVGRGLQILSEE